MKRYYDRGGVELYFCDCRELLPMMLTVSNVSLVTDAPYGIGLENHDSLHYHKRSCWGSLKGDEDQTLGLYALGYAEACNWPTIMFASPWKPWPGEWRNLICWDKGPAVGGGGDTRTCLKRTWELIQVTRTGAINGNRDESVWRFNMLPRDSAAHPATKPVLLMIRLLERFIKSDDVVLDPFAGSGSTLLAGLLLGRKVIGCEVDEKYCELTARRLDAEIDAGNLFEKIERMREPEAYPVCLFGCEE